MQSMLNQILQALTDALKSIPASSGGANPQTNGGLPVAGTPPEASAPTQSASGASNSPASPTTGTPPAASASAQPAQQGEFWAGETGFPGSGQAPFSTPASIADLRSNIVRMARQEWKRWNAGGKKDSRDPRMSSILQDYWQAGVGQPANPAGGPWGAAFISWVMRRAGVGPAFPYSADHSQFIEAALQNRQANNRNPFGAYRTDEVKPAPGDLVCRWSAGGGTPGPGQAPHCFIVTEVQPGQIITVGGDVRNSVGVTRVQTNANGFIADPQTFAVIKLGAPSSS
jgi:hypothetical protein